MESYDVVIVGAGITGLMAALFLQESDPAMKILLLDGAGIGQAQTAVQPGGVRQQWSTEINCRMARFGHAFYREAAERLDDPRIHLREGGYLFLLHDAAERQDALESVRMQQSIGIPTELLEARELSGRFPFLRPRGDALGAAFLQSDGYFDDPRLVVEAVFRRAQERGVVYRQESVRAVELEGGRVKGVLTESGRAEAGTVILAAGLATRSIALGVSVDLPIGSEPRYLLLSEPLGTRLFEPLVISPRDRVAVKQLGSGALLASYTAGSDPRDVADWRGRIQAFAEEVLPAMADVPLTHLVEGRYDSTPDHRGIVGPAGPDGLYIAAGMSGHGFMMAPAVAHSLVALLASRLDTEWPLQELSAARFGRTGGVSEQRVI